MSFIDGLRGHLGNYKRQQLGVQENGVVLHRGKERPKQHVLPHAQRQLNILEPYRTSFFASSHAGMHFHRYFHHLNSSQAMCINLFYPLIAEEKLNMLLGFLGIKPESGWTPEFEKQSSVETAGRRTSFDFHLGHPEAGDIYFDVKYSEVDFGKGRNDEEHRKKFQATYRPLLESSIYLRECCRDEAFFLGKYQLLRNLVHLSEHALVVLLVPAANRDIAMRAREAWHQFLTDAGREKLVIVYLEDLLDGLEEAAKGDPLAAYYTQFRNKYLPGKTTRP